jgi:arylsulfatase A-like enzyme
MYDPDQFQDDLPYEAHRNPTPPMRWAREQYETGNRTGTGEAAFYITPEEAREVKALTAGMITMIDDAVGAVVEALKAADLYDNTVIVFNADHGDFLGDFGLLLKGAVHLRSTTRVPFVWSDPADRRARVASGLASTIDIAPTVIARAGLKPYWGIQGRDIAPLLAGETRVRDELMIEFEDNSPRFGFEKPAGVRTLMTERWRLSFYKDQDWGDLYDLEADPKETHNLWNDPDHKPVRDQLIQRLVNCMIASIETSPRSRTIA